MTAQNKYYVFFSKRCCSDVGHLDFLEQASKLGDYMIVGVHTDPVINVVPLPSVINGDGDTYNKDSTEK